MKKSIKTASGLILVLAVLAVGAGQVFLSRKVTTSSTVPKPGKAQESVQTVVAAPTAASSTTNDKTYTSDAGFRFSYPGDMHVAIRAIEDQDTYASLKLTSPEAGGNISVKIFDSLTKTAAETEPGTKVAMAGLEANEISKSNSITVAAREVNTVYLIECFIDNNQDYWQKAVDKVVNTFAFVEPANTSSDEETVVDGSTDTVVSDTGNDTVEEVVE